MAAASSSASYFGIREEDQTQIKQQQSSTPPSSTAQTTALPKKKRNLPGTPYPDAEVIALSPKSLLATNRFICEVCNKGFQREQNLQLHRRGHNLPWKLRQKSTKEVKRKVYLCPEPTCVHHDPSRALGDLTGIKKHFCRKHGEKKWKCDKCSKRYAVQSDWKAHSKTCGTREHRCDCGTLFSRRDSFITHRAFCDALTQESARLPTGLNSVGSRLYGSLGQSQVGSGSQISSLDDQSHPSTDLLRLRAAGSTQFDHIVSPSNPSPFRPHPSSPFFLPNSNQDFHEESQSHHSLMQNKPFHGLMQLPVLQNNSNTSSSATTSAGSNLFNLSFFSNTSSINDNANNSNHLSSSGLLIPDQFSNSNVGTEPATLFSGNIIGDHIGSSVSSLYNNSVQGNAVLPQMSATALLQKAAQMGATTSVNSSLIRGFANYSSTSPKPDTPHVSHVPANFRGEILRRQLENEAHLQDLMNSLTNGNSNVFGSGSERETGFGGFNPSRIPMEQPHQNNHLSNMDEPTLHRSFAANMGGSDGMTRDFLGVGGMVMPQRDRHDSTGFSSLEPEFKPSAANRHFGGGNLQ